MTSVVTRRGALVARAAGDTRRWWAVEARARALPCDHRIVHDGITGCLFRFSAGGGADLVAVLEGLLGLLQEGAAAGRGALEVTGTDVAGFADELLRSARTYPQRWHDELDRDVLAQLRRVGTQE